jgi:hypothetical protein
LQWEYLKDPELWLALGLFAAFVIVGKWLSKKISGKPTHAADMPKESVLPLGKDESLVGGP